MKEIHLNEEIELMLVKAARFPDGVVPAYQKLEKAIVNPLGRKFYGISRGDKNGAIIYWAGVKPLYGESSRLGLEKFTLKRGIYISETLSDWRGREHVIGETFQKLLADTRIDNEGYCVEEYQDNDDVICMVKIKP